MGDILPYVNTVRVVERDAIWLSLWDSLMNEDPFNFSKGLDQWGLEPSRDGWEIYDIVARFKRWKCMRVLLARVPLKYLKTKHAYEAILPYGKPLRKLIRREAYKRSYILVLLTRLPLPLEIIREVWKLVN